MPFDGETFESEKNEASFAETRRIYISDDGGVRIETRHFRRTFAPEEFVALLRNFAVEKPGKANRGLPILNRTNAKKGVCGLILSVVCFLFLANCAAKSASDGATDSDRVIAVGGAVTETIYALGAESKLVGTDTSSVFPEAATRLPQVGYQRTLSAEGVLSLKPDLVLAMAEAGPPAALSQIESAGVKIVKVNGEHTVDGAQTKIREIAEALNVEAKGEELIKKLDADLSDAKRCVQTLQTKPKVLFIYARGGGAPNVSGTKTAADAMINLAGGQNAVTEFENFKPLTPESLVAAAPDFILFPTRGLHSIGSIDGALKIPGVAETPAGKNRRIIAVDDLILLGFSPRLGEGVKQLCEKLR